MVVKNDRGNNHQEGVYKSVRDLFLPPLAKVDGSELCWKRTKGRSDRRVTRFYSLFQRAWLFG